MSVCVEIHIRKMEMKISLMAERPPSGTLKQFFRHGLCIVIDKHPKNTKQTKGGGGEAGVIDENSTNKQTVPQLFRNYT